MNTNYPLFCSSVRPILVALLVTAVSACSGDISSGNGVDGGAGPDALSTTCLDDDQCAGGLCIDGTCCAAGNVCGSTCCGAEETCFANRCVTPGDTCYSAADCAEDEY